MMIKILDISVEFHFKSSLMAFLAFPASQEQSMSGTIHFFNIEWPFTI